MRKICRLCKECKIYPDNSEYDSCQRTYNIISGSLIHCSDARKDSLPGNWVSVDGDEPCGLSGKLWALNPDIADIAQEIWASEETSPLGLSFSEMVEKEALYERVVASTFSNAINEHIRRTSPRRKGRGR
jgi:hypothetical protein